MDDADVPKESTFAEPTGRHARFPRLTSFLLFGLGAIACGILMVWVWTSERVGTHPLFGAIYATEAWDLNEARSNRVGQLLRDHLPTKVQQSPYFPERFKNQPRYLRLATDQLEWSIGGKTTGWLYFWPVPRSPRNSLWEFARTPESDLHSLTHASLAVDFYRSTDPRIPTVFAEGSNTNAIKVTEGQILFARRVDETNRIYVLKLHKQTGNRLTVHYCVAAPQ